MKPTAGSPDAPQPQQRTGGRTPLRRLLKSPFRARGSGPSAEAAAASPSAEGVAARVLLLGKPGCHLCDEAREVVERVTRELGERYDERDITRDDTLRRAHGESIPVVLVDGVQVDFWRVSEQRLRAALARR